MQHIKMHIAGPGDRKKERITERGEMLKFFLEKLNRQRAGDGLPPMTMARMGKTLEAIPTQDLYYLKSVCEQAPHFSKKFWWEINPKNHTPEKIKERERAREALYGRGNYTKNITPAPPRPLPPAPPAMRAWRRAPRSLD